MNIEKMREEFEGWVQERSVDTPAGFYPQLTHRCTLDQSRYVTSWVDSAWEGWQASRAAIEIEISGYDSLLRALYDGVNIDDVVESIKAQGLRVKVTP